ncbi:hypothetical protein AB4K20DRAFT_1880937 [Rhizopus microsporus]
MLTPEKAKSTVMSLIFSKIGYKTSESLTSRSKKFAYVCLHDFYFGLNKCCHCRNVITK